MRELSLDKLSLSVGLAKDFKTIPEQPGFKTFIALIRHIKHTRQRLFLYVNQHREQYENLWEIKHESFSKVLAIELLYAQSVTVKELLVFLQLLLWEDLNPELQLYDKSHDDQHLSVEQN